MSVLSLDLVDGDVQRSVGPLAHRQGLIDPELCCRHRLPLREGRQIETKLLPVRTRLQEVTLLLHCREERRIRGAKIFTKEQRRRLQQAAADNKSFTLKDFKKNDISARRMQHLVK